MTQINQFVKNTGHWIILLLLILGTNQGVAQSKVTTISSRVSGIKIRGEATGTNTTTQYYDRFGRPVQTVAKQASPNEKDLVSFGTFDSYGRQLRSYMPYPATTNTGAYRNNVLTEQSNFYNPGVAVNYGTTPAPYADVDIEESPFKRTLEQGGIGSDYQLSTGRTSKYEYGLNVASDNVLIWELNSSGGLKLSEDTYYAAYKLDVTTMKAPNWVVADGNVGTSKTFTDYQGRTILTRTFNTSETYDTYYVYDDFNNVAYVISPEAVREVLNGNATTINNNQIFSTTQNFPSGYAKNSAYYYMPGVIVTLNPEFEYTPGFSLEPYPIDESFIEKWLYINEYDDKSRLVSKKVPGSEPVHYVYDKAGRLIMSQDGNQRLSNKWTFTKYDRFERPVLTGELIDARDRDALTSYIDLAIYSVSNNWYEETGSAIHGYTNRVFPTTPTENDYLVVSYYDDYNFKSSWGSNYNHQSNTVNSTTPEVDALGAETGGKIKILGSNTWLKSVNYYDEDGLLIQSVADHHMGNVERFFATYNFVGNLTESRLEHVISGSKTVSLSDRFEYGHAGRLEKQWHSVDDEPEVLVAVNSYNELGEAIETNLHSTDDGLNFIQSIDSRYDIQGRLTHINNAQRNNDGTYNNDGTDQFGMELYYDTSPAGFGINPQYNGGLTSTIWSNGTMTGADQRGYGYTYDRSNRLTAANYKEKVGANWNAKVGHYDVNISDYDYNGNIERLTRKQSIGGSAVTIDDLVYSYNGNQLKAVDDQVNHEKGFKDGAELATEYTYDANGNMITDSNKLITSISYNQLNRPEVITFSSGDKITYTYHASGTRIKQEITVSGTVSQTYDYVGGMIFDNGTLAEISTGAGRLKVDVIGNDYNYDYQYFLTDHLGNTRTMIAPLERKYVAGMETARADQEEAQFLYVSETRYPGQAYTGSNSSMLNAAASKVLGPAKAIKVYNGDQIDMSVWAKHESTSGVNETGVSNVLLTAMSAAFGVNSGSVGESLQIYNGLNTAIGANALIDQSPGNTPAAYLNYIFFNNSYVEQASGFVQVNSTSYSQLSLPFTANQDGFLFVYLSNESTLNANVYFDDLQVVHTSNNAVLQADDFYPFGLPMDNNSFLEAGVSANRFLYQGKEWQTELGLNLYDFHARQFDPSLGRWLAVDPQNQFASPYLGMGNMPNIGIDPNGEIWHIVIGAVVGGIANTVFKAIQGDINSWGDGFKAFGVGALAGGVGAATGGAAFAAAGGAAGGAGGFLAGAAGGAVGSAVSQPIQSLGNHIFFGDDLLSAKEFGIGVLMGGALGGTTNGVMASLKGRNFWNGALKGKISPGFIGPKVNPDDFQVPKKDLPRVSTNELPDNSPRISTNKIPNNSPKIGMNSLDDPLGANGTSLRGPDFIGKAVTRGKIPHIQSGQLTEDTAMTAAKKFLESGYKEVSPGRFISRDGLRQIRFGAHELKSIGNLHIHFEAFNIPYWSGGKIVESTSTKIIQTLMKINK